MNRGGFEEAATLGELEVGAIGGNLAADSVVGKVTGPGIGVGGTNRDYFVRRNLLVTSK